MNQPILDAPSIEYGQLSPMLIVFAVGVLGVIAGAFLCYRCSTSRRFVGSGRSVRTERT